MTWKVVGIVLTGILALVPARAQDQQPAPVAKTKPTEKTTTKKNAAVRGNKPVAKDATPRPASKDESDDEREAEAQEREAERREREQERQEQVRQREEERRERIEEYYEAGREALDEGRWEKAVRRFDDVVQAGGSRADAALYWKAYALNKLARREEALATLADLRKNHPKSRWLNDAGALEIDIQQNSGKPVDPGEQSDCELKLLAINGLMTRQSDDAVPILEKFLKGTGCPKAKSQALFVLAQNDSARGRQVLAEIARGNSNPQLQMRAIQYLGVHGSAENRAVLADVYKSANEPDVKRRIINSFMVSGDRDRLLALARSEPDAGLRGYAINQLGVMGAQSEIWQLYTTETAPEVKEKAINALFLSGNVDRLAEIAKTEKELKLRKFAVNQLGIMGGKRTGELLVQIYNGEKETSIRKQALHSLFLQQNAKGLIEIARKETDPELKKACVNYLSLIHSKEAMDFLMELLNK